MSMYMTNLLDRREILTAGIEVCMFMRACSTKYIHERKLIAGCIMNAIFVKPLTSKKFHNCRISSHNEASIWKSSVLREIIKTILRHLAFAKFQISHETLPYDGLKLNIRALTIMILHKCNTSTRSYKKVFDCKHGIDFQF